MVWKKNSYGKDEGLNLNSMTITLKLVVNYEALNLRKVIREFTFDMHFLKHVNIGLLIFFCKGLKDISIKFA
jgi:hypothetical protein